MYGNERIVIYAPKNEHNEVERREKEGRKQTEYSREMIKKGWKKTIKKEED